MPYKHLSCDPHATTGHLHGHRMGIDLDDNAGYEDRDAGAKVLRCQGVKVPKCYRDERTKGTACN